MFSLVLAVNEDVVEEHHYEVVQQRAEDALHQVHEGCRCVGQPEGQHQELEVTVAGAERGLVDVRVVDANLPVAGAKVNLAETLRAVQAVEQLVDARQRVLVLDRRRVERAVVDAQSQRAVGLAVEQHWSAVG